MTSNCATIEEEHLEADSKSELSLYLAVESGPVSEAVSPEDVPQFNKWLEEAKEKAVNERRTRNTLVMTLRQGDSMVNRLIKIRKTTASYDDSIETTWPTVKSYNRLLSSITQLRSHIDKIVERCEKEVANAKELMGLFQTKIAEFHAINEAIQQSKLRQFNLQDERQTLQKQFDQSAAELEQLKSSPMELLVELRENIKKKLSESEATEIELKSVRAKNACLEIKQTTLEKCLEKAKAEAVTVQQLIDERDSLLRQISQLTSQEKAKSEELEAMKTQLADLRSVATAEQRAELLNELNETRSSLEQTRSETLAIKKELEMVKAEQTNLLLTAEAREKQLDEEKLEVVRLSAESARIVEDLAQIEVEAQRSQLAAVQVTAENHQELSVNDFPTVTMTEETAVSMESKPDEADQTLEKTQRTLNCQTGLVSPVKLTSPKTATPHSALKSKTNLKNLSQKKSVRFSVDCLNTSPVLSPTSPDHSQSTIPETPPRNMPASRGNQQLIHGDNNGIPEMPLLLKPTKNIVRPIVKPLDVVVKGDDEKTFPTNCSPDDLACSHSSWSSPEGMKRFIWERSPVDCSKTTTPSVFSESSSFADSSITDDYHSSPVKDGPEMEGFNALDTSAGNVSCAEDVTVQPNVEVVSIESETDSVRQSDFAYTNAKAKPRTDAKSACQTSNDHVKTSRPMFKEPTVKKSRVEKSQSRDKTRLPPPASPATWKRLRKMTQPNVRNLAAGYMEAVKSSSVSKKKEKTKKKTSDKPADSVLRRLAAGYAQTVRLESTKLSASSRRVPNAFRFR